ncbi:MAG: hypothetical protein U0R44_03995 [Candidatus Micrarchaeia archaeon]
MKKLEHCSHEGETFRKRFSKLAVAAGVLVSTAACVGPNMHANMNPAITEPAVVWPSSYASTERVARVGSSDVLLLRLSKPMDQLLREADGYRAFDGTRQVESDGQTYDVYMHESLIRNNTYSDQGMSASYDMRFFFALLPSHRYEVGVFFPAAEDYIRQEGPHEEPGARHYRFGQIRPDIDESIASVRIIIENSNSYVTAHAIPYNAQGERVGRFPEGQLAYGITFVPLTRRSFGGMAILQDP